MCGDARAPRDMCGSAREAVRSSYYAGARGAMSSLIYAQCAVRAVPTARRAALRYDALCQLLRLR